jgi:hypothetical protein
MKLLDKILHSPCIWNPHVQYSHRECRDLRVLPTCSRVWVAPNPRRPEPILPKKIFIHLAKTRFQNGTARQWSQSSGGRTLGGWNANQYNERSCYQIPIHVANMFSRTLPCQNSPQQTGVMSSLAQWSRNSCLVRASEAVAVLVRSGWLRSGKAAVMMGLWSRYLIRSCHSPFLTASCSTMVCPSILLS